MKRADYTLYIAKLYAEVLNGYLMAVSPNEVIAWEDVPFAEQKQIIEHVEWRIANRKAPVSEHHNRWLVGMMDAGWRIGERLDVSAMLHPLLRPWDSLPDSQKAKDYIFVALVNGLTSQEVFEPAVPMTPSTGDAPVVYNTTMGLNTPTDDPSLADINGVAVKRSAVIEQVLKTWSMTRDEFDKQIESRQQELIDSEFEKNA